MQNLMKNPQTKLEKLNYNLEKSKKAVILALHQNPDYYKRESREVPINLMTPTLLDMFFVHEKFREKIM